MKTQHAWLFLTLPILLLAATLTLVNTSKNSTPLPARDPAQAKIGTPDVMVYMDYRFLDKDWTDKLYNMLDFQRTVLTYLPGLPHGKRFHQASIGFQADQAGPDTAAYFKLQNVAGGFMTSEDLKGKVTVVDIWATWCEWCVEEIPIYNQLFDAFEGHDVALVGIAVESSRSDIQSKVRQLGIKYPVLIGDDEALEAFGRVQGFPTTLVMSKEGKIYKHYMGAVPRKAERIKQDIEYLLVERSR